MKLYFKKTGEGKPLIILHGLFGMGDNWMTQSRQFGEKGFLVYTVDARNHGRSPHSPEFNYLLMKEDVIEMMNDEKISSASVIGHSMGGKTAMWLSCLHEERVSKLVVADIAPRYYPPHHQGVIAAIHSVDLMKVTSRTEAAQRLRQTLQDEDTVQFLLKNLYWVGEANLAWRFHLEGIEKNILSVGDALPEGYQFKNDTLFLRGVNSGYVTEDDNSEIMRHFPHAVIESVPDAGHWIHAENPEGFFKAVLKFLG